MRITNNMMVSNMMRNLNSNLTRLDRLQNQMATGKKISKPSDDPVGMAQVLKLTSDTSAAEQHKKNVDQAVSWLETTEISVTQLKDVMQRVRELTVRGATGSLAVEDKQAIQKEITQLKDQVLSIGNSTFSGRYIFGGYNTMEQPFTVEETPTGEKLKYNGKFVSPGGAVDSSVSDADFINFLTNPNNKELTNEQVADKLKIEIGIGDMINVNVNGNELFEKGFGGVFETLSKLENVLNGVEDYKHGFVDMEFATDTTTLGATDLDNSTGDRKISVTLGNDAFTLKLPSDNLTQESIQKSIDSNEHLKKNGVKVILDGNDISFSSQGKITVNASLGGTIITDEPANHKIAPLLVGERLSSTVETTATNIDFTLNVGATDYDIDLPDNKLYDIGSTSGKNELIKDIKQKLVDLGINDQVQMSFTSDNRLQFKGQYKDATSPTFDDITISGGITANIGFVDGQQSTKAVVKAEKIEADDMLGDIDKNMENILAKLAEIGAKTNRLELSQNRLDDNILNMKSLLSKVQDVDMAEAIMNLKMEEMVYQSSLSTGARVIQPTLIDFIR